MSTRKDIVGKLVAAMEQMELDPFVVGIRSGHLPVEDVLTGRNQDPKLSVLLAIADVVGVMIDVVQLPPPARQAGTHEPRVKTVVQSVLDRFHRKS